MQQWEHRVVSATTNDQTALEHELVKLGAEGWEVVGVSGVDRTIGMNAVVCVVKRPVVPPPPPDDIAEGWKPDPVNRWEVRYWNGQTWTAHVANKEPKKQGLDPPQTLPA